MILVEAQDYFVCRCHLSFFRPYAVMMLLTRAQQL